MILALLGAFLFSAFSSGGQSLHDSLKAVQARVAEAVGDETRAAKVESQFRDLFAKVDKTNAEFQKKNEGFLELIRRYDSDPAEIRAVLDEAMKLRVLVQGQVLDARTAIRDTMTREEWAAAFKPR